MFGSVLNNQFTSNLTHNVPSPVVHGLRAAGLDNANALGSTQAQQAIARIVTSTAQALGRPLTALAALVEHGLRLSLEQAISTLFVVSTVIGLIGLIVVIFLPEVRLRTSYDVEELKDRADEGLDVGIALDAPEVKPATETE